jgi:hypothetical protein
MKITREQLKQVIKEEIRGLSHGPADRPADKSATAQDDIANAIGMLEAEEDVSGTLFYVIEALQAALEKIGGQEVPRYPHDGGLRRRPEY